MFMWFIIIVALLVIGAFVAAKFLAGVIRTLLLGITLICIVLAVGWVIIQMPTLAGQQTPYQDIITAGELTPQNTTDKTPDEMGNTTGLSENATANPETANASGEFS